MEEGSGGGGGVGKQIGRDWGGIGEGWPCAMPYLSRTSVIERMWKFIYGFLTKQRSFVHSLPFLMAPVPRMHSGGG